LLPLQGYEYNRGTAYVPFNILNEQGVETPAQYVKVHLEVPNPFAEACMSMQGPVYVVHGVDAHDSREDRMTIAIEQWLTKQWIELGTDR
jgi:hypothetical protein